MSIATGEPCPTCGVEVGVPCRDLRMTTGDMVFATNMPHKGRGGRHFECMCVRCQMGEGHAWVRGTMGVGAP